VGNHRCCHQWHSAGLYRGLDAESVDLDAGG
jgi:hypothetical protein